MSLDVPPVKVSSKNYAVVATAGFAGKDISKPWEILCTSIFATVLTDSTPTCCTINFQTTCCSQREDCGRLSKLPCFSGGGEGCFASSSILNWCLLLSSLRMLATDKTLYSGKTYNQSATRKTPKNRIE